MEQINCHLPCAPDAQIDTNNIDSILGIGIEGEKPRGAKYYLISEEKNADVFYNPVGKGFLKNCRTMLYVLSKSFFL